MNKAIFLDRDGVINDIVFHEDVEVMDSPFNIDQVNIMDGVFESIAAFKDLGYLVIIVTNQPGAAKGKMTLDRINEINTHIIDTCKTNGALIDDVFVCPHHPTGTPSGLKDLIRACDCRKPEPGMITQAVRKYNISPENSFIIGDTHSDILAGKKAGLNTVLLGIPKCDKCRMLQEKNANPDSIVPDLMTFVKQLKGGKLCTKN